MPPAAPPIPHPLQHTHAQHTHTHNTQHTHKHTHTTTTPTPHELLPPVSHGAGKKEHTRSPCRSPFAGADIEDDETRTLVLAVAFGLVLLATGAQPKR